MVNKKVPWSVYLDLIIQNRDVMGNSWESHGTPRKVRNWMIFAQFFLDGHGCHQSIFIVIHTPSC
jgi:hypothetical protein